MVKLDFLVPNLISVLLTIGWEKLSYNLHAMAIGGLDMKYKVEGSIDLTFENIRNIRLGSGKSFFVYKDNEPVLSVEINTPICFYDAIIYYDYLVIGNYHEGIYCINLNNS